MPLLTLPVACPACGSAFCTAQRERRGITRCLYTSTDMTAETKSTSPPKRRGAIRRK